MIKFKIQPYFIVFAVLGFVDAVTCIVARPALRSALDLYVKLRSPLTSYPELAQIGKQMFMEKDYDQALQFYNRAIEENPNAEASYYLGRGNTYKEIDELNSAISDFRKATLTAEKAGKGELLEFDDTELGNWGNKLMEIGKTEDAYWCYTEAIKRNPLEPSYYRLRGNLHFQNGDLSQTLSDYRKAVSVAKESGKEGISVLGETELIRLGDKLMKDKRIRGALWCYDQAIETNPSVEEYYRRRGVCHEKLGDIEKAISDYKRGLKLVNNLSNYYVLVRTMFDAGKYDEALEEIRTLNAAEVVDLAHGFVFFKKYEDAIRLYTDAIAKNSSNVEAYKERGNCHMKLKNLKKALPDYGEVLNLVSNHGHIEDKLKEVLVEAKKYYGAKKGLAQLL